MRSYVKSLMYLRSLINISSFLGKILDDMNLCLRGYLMQHLPIKSSRLDKSIHY